MMPTFQTRSVDDDTLPSALRAWNEASAEEAAAAILPCNGSPAWAAGMAERRPIETTADLFAAADDVWASLGERDRQQAFASHPRVGQRHAATATRQSLQWSAGEQRAATPDDAARAALALGNQTYEERFGHIFLICATGKSAADILENLQRRMNNDMETEMRIAAEEQRKITQIRLGKWLSANAGFAFREESTAAVS